MSAMEVLCDDLSSKGENNVRLLISPKYHPEIAGEGIEYVWGLMKKMYRKIKYEDKKGKEHFEKAIKKCVRQVNRIHVCKFVAKCRRYMLAYANRARQTSDGEAQLTFNGIEKFVKRFKCHRNCADTDPAFLAEVLRQSYL